jgi:hypothetical protein
MTMRETGCEFRGKRYEFRDTRYEMRVLNHVSRITNPASRLPHPELRVALFPPVSPVSLESGISSYGLLMFLFHGRGLSSSL